MTTEESGGLDAILQHVKATRGFDFTGYKTASIQRRVAKRIEAVGSASHAEYLDHLQVDPDEYRRLFDTILINVTAFFRDPDAWNALRDDVLATLAEAHGATDPIRVWCAGCASGEEAYTIAILLCETLGVQAFSERVKIYGTDVDEDALDQARQGTYTAAQLAEVPDELRDRYFTPVDTRFTFRKDLRRALIFGRNDLVQDAPISKIDLLTCRNTLMYFNAETQRRILRRFHFALREDGHLFLGKSEMLLSRGELFRPVDLRQRIFQPVPIPRNEGRVPPNLLDGSERPDPPPALVAALDASPVAQLVIDRDLRLAFANETARTMLDIASVDLGRPLHEFRASYRPAELRSALELVLSDGRPVELDLTTAEFGGEQKTVQIRLAPLRSEGEVEAAVVHFIDVTPQRRVEMELEKHKAELSAAYEELQSTIEELETTNEELQSTNEELETTNEELQSTNEELETMNEELQSSNEELETTNEELRSRSLQLKEANAFLDTILTSIGVGVMVVDRDQRVRVWNAQSEDLWGVRREEAIGEHVLTLDIGLPLEPLRAPLQQATKGDDPTAGLTVEAVDRRGRTFTCAINVVSLGASGDTSAGVIILARRANEPSPLEVPGGPDST